VFLARVGAGRLARWCLFDAIPTEEDGGFVFVGLDGRAPVMQPDPRGMWSAHYATSCPGLDRAHRAFAADVIMGRVPSMPRAHPLAPPSSDEDSDEHNIPDEAA
jgi:hypothetical protein